MLMFVWLALIMHETEVKKNLDFLDFSLFQ